MKTILITLKKEFFLDNENLEIAMEEIKQTGVVFEIDDKYVHKIGYMKAKVNQLGDIYHLEKLNCINSVVLSEPAHKLSR
jgi:hypothetical protein